MEILKEQSDFLRHPLMEELVTEEPNINEGALQLMKFHGSYQQASFTSVFIHQETRSEQDSLRQQGMQAASLAALTAGPTQCRQCVHCVARVYSSVYGVNLAEAVSITPAGRQR